MLSDARIRQIIREHGIPENIEDSLMRDPVAQGMPEQELRKMCELVASGVEINEVARHIRERGTRCKVERMPCPSCGAILHYYVLVTGWIFAKCESEGCIRISGH